MLSDKLIWLVEREADRLEKRWAEMLRDHPATTSYHTLDDADLERSIREVYRRLGHYIESNSNVQELADLFMNIGIQRRKQGIPLHELVFAIILARRNIWNFIMEEETALSTLQYHRINEFWQRITNFFDKNIYFVVCGYTKEPAGAKAQTDAISKIINAFTLGSLPEVEKHSYSEH